MLYYFTVCSCASTFSK